ncbi:MAG: hypothetical protein NZM35_09540 [Chitinophagales bacterium]|nr:hypothetical protein [Chitinophagales bacterium]MDW8419494.1 hypothetical protein [Chitinophagales bacterium]
MAIRLNIIGILLFAGVAISFLPPPDENNEHYKNKGYFFAILNGNIFEMRDDEKYRAELIYRTGALVYNNANLKQVTTSLSFFGNEFRGPDGKLFLENIEIEYSFDNGTLGEPRNLRIEVHYDLKEYYNDPQYSRFRISKIEWSPDSTYFYLSADFDCRMFRWGYPRDNTNSLRLKGKMVNIEVTVPRWMKLNDTKVVARN